MRSLKEVFVGLDVRRRGTVTPKNKNSPGDEIANVNFLYNDIVHLVQNAVDSCIHSATDPRGYVLEHRFTKFSEITQCNGHYAVQGHSSRSFKVTDFGTNRKLIYDFLLVFNTNLPSILHRFQVMADYWSNFRRVPHFNALAGGVPLPISP